MGPKVFKRFFFSCCYIYYYCVRFLWGNCYYSVVCTSLVSVWLVYIENNIIFGIVLHVLLKRCREGLFLDSMEKGKTRLKQVLPWKLIPWKISAFKHYERWKIRNYRLFPGEKTAIKPTITVLLLKNWIPLNLLHGKSFHGEKA